MFFDFPSLCKSTLSLQYLFFPTLISYMSSTILWFCFINTVYTFFLIYPKKMEVKHDNMPYRVGYIVTREGHIVTWPCDSLKWYLI